MSNRTKPLLLLGVVLTLASCGGSGNEPTAPDTSVSTPAPAADGQVDPLDEVDAALDVLDTELGAIDDAISALDTAGTGS